jgi:hypothetical protein
MQVQPEALIAVTVVIYENFNIHMFKILPGLWLLPYIKVKQSHNRPGVAQRVPRGLDSQISMTVGT